MQLKEFSLISPALEAKEIFQAIQTVIPPEAIAIRRSLALRDRIREKQQLGKTKTEITGKFSGLLSNCHEHMVIRFDGNCAAKSS